MPPKRSNNSHKKRNNWNKRKSNKKNGKKRPKKGDADMSELASIFNSVRSNKSRNKSRSKQKKKTESNSNTTSTKLITSKQTNLSIIKNSLNNLSNPQNTVIPFISRKKQRKMENKDKSKKQLQSLPNDILIPKCSYCHYKLIIKRGDQCYSEYASVSCDYCGREDIHGEVWHCNQCENKKGFNLCRTCGYLISHKRQNEIRRVAPPQDDMGLLFNKSARNRTTSLDGFTIYKNDEVQKTLKIGMGKNTKLCPFDCQCCF